MADQRRNADPSCACCAGAAALDRRGLLRGAGAAALLAGLSPGLARAASGTYEAMILACIDPRIQEPVHRFARRDNLIGQFSQFVIAGAAIGVVAPRFADWHKAFWDNLAISVELHAIKKVIAIDHRDCGAAKLAYGAASVATPQSETATHRAALLEFRREVGRRHPALAVETALMALDGSMVTFS